MMTNARTWMVSMGLLCIVLVGTNYLQYRDGQSYKKKFHIASELLAITIIEAAPTPDPSFDNRSEPEKIKSAEIKNRVEWGQLKLRLFQYYCYREWGLIEGNPTIEHHAAANLYGLLLQRDPKFDPEDPAGWLPLMSAM